MSQQPNQDISRRIITTQPSYRIATTSYPDIRLHNDGKQTITRIRNIDTNQQSIIERSRRQNIPTSPHQDHSYLQRTQRSQINGNNSRRKSNINQNEYSHLSADKSYSNNAKLHTGAYGQGYHKNGKLHRRNNSQSQSGRSVGTIQNGHKKKMPICCRKWFFVILAALALLGVAVALFFLLRGSGQQYHDQTSKTIPTNLRDSNGFSDPYIIKRQTTIVKNSQNDPITQVSQQQTSHNTNQKYQYRSYLDENGMRQTIAVPIQQNSDSTSNNMRTSQNWKYKNLLKQNKGQIEIRPGYKKPYYVQETSVEQIIG